ncbi:MAG TPA: tetratricopeptide repeat protein, partial [Anaeromyxobacteraceae bacterium]|nr:tetratricopeptide repeat protein [Anaeromyxobacteraceae bacterium]
MSTPTLDEQIRSHLETLEAAPGDAGAFQALEGLYEQDSRWEDLVALYEGRARLLADPGAGPALLAKAAGLAHARLKNVARAEELYRQLLSTDPQNPAALRSLVRLFEEREDWPGVAAALDREAQNTADPRDAARLTLQLGRVQEDRLGRRDRAALLYARACRLDPSLEEARTLALACHVALRRFAQAKRTLDAARDSGADRRGIAAEYARLGAVLADEPLEHDLAMDALVDALSLDRAAPGAVELRERLRAVPRTWRQELEALDGRIAAAADRREAAALHLRAAQLHAAYDPDGAARVAERVDRAWALAPGNGFALDLLERVFGERSDWRGLSDALARLAASTRDRSAQVALYLRVAQTDLVRFGDAPAALASLERALELDPSCEPAALQAFEHLYNGSRWEEALAVLERHLAAAPEKPQHAPLRVRAAEMAREKLGDAARARRHLEAALRADPGHAPAAAALAPLLAEAGEWQKLSDVLERRLRAEPDAAERVRILERIAEVQQDRLSRPRDALRTLARALALDPRRAATRKAMEGAAARAGAFTDLARAYRSAAEAVEGDLKAKKTLLRRVAEIHDRDLEQPEEAVRAWRDLVALDPEDRGAAAALEACLARAGKHQEVARALEERVERAEGAEKRDAAVKLARLWQEASDPERAAAAWRALLAASPDDLDALWGLHAALEATAGPRAAEERVLVLARLAARAKGHAERAALELERAEVLADAIGRLGEAAGVAIAALQSGGLTPGQQSQAVGFLERMMGRGVDPLRIAQVLAPAFAAAGEPAKQVTMLEVMARRLPPEADARERARHLLDAAAVRAERLGDPRGAFSDAAAALRVSPDHVEARRLCERLAAEVGAWAELFAALVDAARRLEARPEEERALRLRAAAVAEEELGSPDDAAAQLRRCLALRPDDAEVLAALTRTALAAERWSEASDLLAARAGRAQGDERAALLGQRAEVLLERLRDPAAAAATLRDALSAAPAELRPRLLSRLADAAGAAGDAAGRATALAELGASAGDPALAARASIESARIQAGMGDALGAVERLRAALEARPDDLAALAELEKRLDDTDPAVVLAAARALAPVHARRGDPRRRIQALEAEARHRPDAAGRAAAKREIARAWEQDLQQVSPAFAALADAARAVPGDAEVRRELRRVAEAARDPEGCARVYDELVPAAPAEARVPVLREQAEWLENRVGAADRAAEAWGRVLAAAPGDAEALGALRRLHRARERWPELAQACEEIARRAAGAAARAEALREAAEVAEVRLGDPARAAGAWRQVAGLSPGDADAEAALLRLAERLDRPAEVAAALERRLARGFDADAALRLAELKRARLGDLGGAVSLLATVLRADPARGAARDALVELA